MKESATRDDRPAQPAAHVSEHQPALDAPPAAAVRSSPRTAAQLLALQRSVGNRATVARVRPPATAPAARGGGEPVPVQRGEAGVHQDIELTATGVARPSHLGHGLQHPVNMSADQQRAMEMYSGNWMRDFSQFLVPAAFDAIADVPRRPHGGREGIGNAGAEQLIVGLLRALASIEFGPQITDRLMTGPNIGVYRPEEHMDHPAGMSLGGDVLVRGAGGALRPAGAGDRNDPSLQGSAVAGPQVENAALLTVGEQGLGQHLYNTSESVKGRLMQAHRLGPTPEGRMQLGAGMHGVEDYFSHSNFIEVALNILLSQRRHQGVRSRVEGAPAQGPVVDTLYDETVGEGANRRQAITTGTFTALDTKVSIAHVLLPKLPTLFTGIDRSIDRTLLAIQSEGSTWAEIKEQLKTDRAGAAFTYLLDGMDAAGMELPSARIEKWQVPDLPDALPDAVERGLEGRWLATGITPLSLRPSAAIPSYGELYRDARQIWEHREELRMMLNAVVRLIDGMPAWMVAALAGLRVVRNQLAAAAQVLSQSLSQLISTYTQQLKQQVQRYLFETIERLTGIDVPAEKRARLEDWVEAIQHGTESLSHATSLEHQLRAGTLDIPANERANRLPQGALPPSHSEVSKDHPDHREHGNGAEGAAAEPGQGHVHGASLESMFFDVHRDLAVAADRHLVGLMEEAWQATGHQGARINQSGNRPTLSAEERSQRDAQAAGVAERGAALAAREHRRFAQSAGGVPPALLPALNAVDLYISHPADSTWWRPIIERHFDGERLEELIEGIEARNRTRSRRGAWDPVGAARGDH